MEIEGIGDIYDSEIRSSDWFRNEPHPLTSLIKTALESSASWMANLTLGNREIIHAEKPFDSFPEIHPKISPTYTPDAQFNTQVDEEIIGFCNENHSFAYRSFSYKYRGVEYEIQVLHNPEQQFLWSEELKSVVRWPCVLTASTALPVWLENHLTEIAKSMSSKTVVDLKPYRNYLPEVYTRVYPVEVSQEIENPEFDREIRELFAANAYVNRVFHYDIGGRIYSVRIIHNPEKNTLSWKQRFNFKDGEVKAFVLDWTNKYGIFVDRIAPDALVDHLTKLVSASWWDWYFNFKVENGSYVYFSETTWYITHTLTTTYTTVTWFEYTNDQYMNK
ncbi:MAG: hypothetical protein K1X28_03610 [Parachlamydiales bacterium]|nr:hypothetical protein [Parachlamydiales bacterium]